MKIKSPFSKNYFLILAPLVLVMILDLVFTLAGQPEVYWEGNYDFLNEGSPLGVSLLGYHPGTFLLFFVFYLLLVLFLLVNLKRPLNIMVAIGFFLGHSWGSASWLGVFISRFSLFKNCSNFVYWYATIAYFIIIAIISGFCIDKWLKNNSKERDIKIKK